MVDTLRAWARRLGPPPVPTMSMASAAPSGRWIGSDGLEHGVDHPRHLVDGLALHAQGDDVGGDLGVGGVAGQDLGHGRVGLIGGQVVARR